MNTSTPMPRDIDRILDAWFEEGPTLSADRVVGAALADTEQVRQVHPRWLQRVTPPALLPSSQSRLAVILAALALLVAAVGIGLALGFFRDNRLPPPDASPLPDALNRFVFAEDGFELALPTGWVQLPTVEEGVWRFQSADEHSEFTVSYGDSVLNTGRITICGLDDCRSQTISASVPYGVERSMLELQIGVQVRLDPELNEIYDLADEAIGSDDGAERQRLTENGIRRLYVYAIHDTRPIVLYWSVSAEAYEDLDLQEMLEEFHFLGTEVLTPREEFTVVIDDEGGWSAPIPVSWPETQYPQHPDGFPGVRRFGQSHDHPNAQLTISIGDPDGTVWLCSAATCEETVVRNIGELDAALEVAPEEILERVIRRDTSLGGEPAVRKRPDTGFFVGGPPALEYVYTFHGGRPVVVTIDHWLLVNDGISRSALRTILDGFAFED